MTERSVERIEDLPETSSVIENLLNGGKEESVRMIKLPPVSKRYVLRGKTVDLNNTMLIKKDHGTSNKSAVKSNFKLPNLVFPFSPRK